MAAIFEDFDPRDQALLLRGALGFDLQKEKETVLYKYLVMKAKEQAEQAATEFAGCDLEDLSKLAELQAAVRRHLELQGWIEQAIQEGAQARMEFDTRRADAMNLQEGIA